MNLERRVCKLEAQIHASQPSWTSDVESARTRAAAWVRLEIGEALDAVGHPAVLSARTLLIGDTPAQAAANLETLTRWRATHDLNSLVQPKSEAEAQWLRMRGKVGARGGVEGALTYATALAYSHRCEEAIRLLDEAHRRYPLDVRVRTARANVRMLAGDLSTSVWAESWRGLRGAFLIF
jgi:hypothetical protein